MSKLLFEDTFENFEVNMYNRNAYLTAMDFVKEEMKKGMMLGIFGLEGTGKTRLLRAIANFYAMENPAEEVVYITGEELRQELNTAIRRKDIFIFALKKRFRKTRVVCLDEVQVLLQDDEVRDWYLHWFHHCKRRNKRMIYTHDCDERMYCAFQKMAEWGMPGVMVGIPKPGQDRSIREVE